MAAIQTTSTPTPLYTITSQNADGTWQASHNRRTNEKYTLTITKLEDRNVRAHFVKQTNNTVEQDAAGNFTKISVSVGSRTITAGSDEVIGKLFSVPDDALLTQMKEQLGLKEAE